MQICQEIQGHHIMQVSLLRSVLTQGFIRVFLQEIRESMIRASYRLVWTDGAHIRQDPSYQYY